MAHPTATSIAAFNESRRATVGAADLPGKALPPRFEHERRRYDPEHVGLRRGSKRRYRERSSERCEERNRPRSRRRWR